VKTLAFNVAKTRFALHVATSATPSEGQEVDYQIVPSRLQYLVPRAPEFSSESKPTYCFAVLDEAMLMIASQQAGSYQRNTGQERLSVPIKIADEAG
jgi:hypothetical protein